MMLRRKGPPGNILVGPERVYIPVNTSYTEIYTTLKGHNLPQYSPLSKPNLSLKFSKKYC
jgi:hypothetical protein